MKLEMMRSCLFPEGLKIRTDRKTNCELFELPYARPNVQARYPFMGSVFWLITV